MDDAEWLAQYGYRVGLRGQIVKVGRDRKRYPMRPGYIRPKDWRAAAWLTTYLKAQPDGWAWSAQVKADGIAAGYPLPTLKRGRVLAGVRAQRVPVFGNPTIWAL
jgi:hypothetical protein